MKSPWIGIAEAAELLEVKPETVLARVRFRELPVAQFSLEVRIWRKAVEEKARLSAARVGGGHANEQEAENG